MLDQGFLVATILVVIALLFYVLYWNRLLALILSLVLRVVLWNKGGPSVWIQIGSLHISLLSGRILLKDFRYHSSNQSIKVVKVQLRWQYWVRALAASEHIQAHAGGEEPNPGNTSSRSPRCRFHATFEGFEWFLYNRTAAFDNIVAQMDAKTPVPERRAQSPAAASHLRQIFTKSPAGGDHIAQTPRARAWFTTPKFVRRFTQWLRKQLPDLDFKDLLPLSFEGINGGIVLGNMSTSNILVAEFTRADGVFGTVPSRSPLDLYKQVLNIKFQNATITFKENEQYQAPMVSTGSHIHEQLRRAHSLSFTYFHYLTYSVFSKLYRSARLRDGLRAAAQSFKRQPSDTSARSFRIRTKRAHSIDNETPVGPDSAKREYAIQRRVLEAPILELSYYADAVGIVPAKQRPVDNEGCDIGNGDVSPEWGFDLVVHGGILRYGPWADRQRAEIQRIFFPSTYNDAEQTRRLFPGDNRLWTAMRIFVELRGGTTLHIPFREASKNWQWDGYVNVPRPRTREAASLSIRAGDDSTISYVMPMVADAQGYHPLLEVHLDSVTVSSSLNDVRVLTTESCRVSGELPSPLKWNASRQWAFHVSLRQPVFYLLRDHINMFTDLGKDWSSGPPSDYFTWVPMRYAVNLDLRNYVIHTYVNDHNIIDKPLLREENALLTLRGASLRNENIIMSDKFRPAWTSFPFSIDAPDVTLSLTLPKWSTHRLQTMEPVTRLMTVGLLRLDGSYLYFSDVREENVDQLRLCFTLNDVIFKCLAWSLRHLMIFQQNYFGTFTHFSTLGEYLQKRGEGQIGDPINLTYRPGMSNQMQVEVQLGIHHSLIVLPVGLPGYETYSPIPGQSPQDVSLGGCVVLSVPEIELELRSHNFGLELNLNTGTIYGEVESDYTERSLFTRSQWYPSSEVFVIEGIDILADRLFGPPPQASTYVCFWELNFGAMKGLLSAPQGRTLQSAIDAFTMNFKDPINAPAAEFALPSDPDVTFLRISIASMELTWSAELVSVHLYVPQGLRMASNDLAGNNYQKVTSLTVPKVIMRFLHTLGKNNDWVEAGEVVFDVALDKYSSPSGWKEGALSQANFLAEQDEPTGRLRKLKIGLGKRGRALPPRSVHTAFLRLPRPLPQAHSSAPSRSDGPNRSDLTKPTPFSHRHLYSDSDDEGSYTVIDHDVRLANSRPPSALPLHHADDESMSSGDESDNMDLTEGSSCGSDLSEWNEDCPAAREHSLAFRYAKVSRHYSLPVDKPSFWVDTPVFALRDRRPYTNPVVRPADSLEEYEHDLFKQWKADIAEDEGSTSTIRISSHSCEVWVTPLLPSVIIHLLEDNSRAAMSPEQRLDAATTTHIRDLLSKQDIIRDSIFDVRVSSIHVQVVQLMHKLRDQPDGLLHVPNDVHHHAIEEEVAVVDLQLFDLGLKGQVHKEDKHSRQSFAASANHFEISLHLHDVHRSLDWSKHRTVIKASLSGVASAFVHKRADLVWRALSVELETEAADYIPGVISAHTDTIIDAIDAYRRLRSRILSGARVRIHLILQWAQKHSVVDPLSTIQPSYLVQSGRPREIRVHPASKILIYIRSCLRFLSVDERQAIHHLTGEEDDSVTREDVIALLEGQLAGLAIDGDATGLANISIIARIFGAPDLPRPAPAHERPIQAVGIRLRSTKISVLHPTRGASSEVSLSSVDITAALKKSELHLASSKAPKDLIVSRDKNRSVVQQVSVSAVLNGIEVLMLPHILNLAQSLVRLRKRPRNATRSPPSPLPTPQASQSLWKTTFLVDVVLSLNALRLQVAAEKLIVAFNVSHLDFVSSAYIRAHSGHLARPDLSANASLFLDSMALEAHSSSDRDFPVPQDMLAEISVKKTNFNCALRHEVTLSPTIRAALVVGSLRLSVPRSAIRLWKFIEEWKADYLPGFERTIQALVSELRKGPSPQASPTTAQLKFPSTHLQLSVGSCGVFLHVLPGTWLSWELFDTLAYLKLGVGVVKSRRLSSSFGLRFSSQRVSIASHTKGGRPEDAPEKGRRLKVGLPSITITGTYENHGVHVLVSAGFFSITVKPSYWDTLLSVQQKFGNDINDLLHVIADARARNPPSQKLDVSPPSPSQSQWTLQSGSFKAKGFRIGLVGHSSTLFFECQDIAGGLKGGEGKGKGKGESWQLNVTGLALSLAPRAFAVVKSVEFDGNRRSAFVIIDCKVEVDHSATQKFLRIKFSKINAILQPSSIGEIGDFVDHLQAKVLDRKDERVRELAAFKEKTERIMETFEVNDRESTPLNDAAWLKDHAVVFSVSNVGVAFPLALDSGIEIPLSKPHQHPAVPAFLFSVKTVEFEAKNTGHSQFVMTGFSFQFVDRFRQSVPGDFAGDGHQTGNRLIYPDMKAQVRTERSARSLRIRVGANISGFILDLEPSIADHVASLVDVYRRGKERVDRFTVNAPRHAAAQDPEPNPGGVSTDKDESPPAASSILLSMVFLSGQVRMHSGAATYIPRMGSLYDRKGNTRPASLVETFNLPMLSVWGEYRATSAQRDPTSIQDAEPPSLVLKSTIHSSENTLRPSLLPFMTDLVNHAERRMRKPSSSSSSASARAAALPLPLGPNPSYPTPAAPSMQITFALRIDQSKLQLTCQPDVNVIAGVYWESGGFLLNVSESGRRISFIGNVGGLTIGLKHGFLSEDCVRLDARNLAFSTTYTAADKASGLDVSSMSVVVDTEVSGGLRFSRFQDVLCFKAVWLDRIPVLSATSGGESEDTFSKLRVPPTPGTSQPKTGFTTAVLVRIRRIGLNVDLGQSISSVGMDMLDVTLRSKIEEMSAELSLSIGDLTMLASGNISGRARIPDFSFSTMRRKALALDSSDLLGEPRMLDMSLKSGNLEMTLESDYQKILHLWSEPLSVTVWDDWSQMSPHVAVLDRLLRLSFTVSGTEVVAVGSVSTIPKLVSYGSRFIANLDAQREGAARESKAFRIAQSPKPDNPLSAFANAMLQTARTRLREKEDSLSYVVQQRMQFSLGSLRLVVFPRTMEDNEMASFTASDLHSDLDLIVESSDLPAKRKLHLAFSGMSASRVGPLNHGAVPADVRTDVRRWLGALRKDTPVSTIFELPAMDMEMESEEASGVLEYDFVSQFARGDMTAARREDIFITLNMALYSWLTLLRKNLAREMNQAQAQGLVDRRPATGLLVPTPSGTTTPRRRRTITESLPPDIASLSTTNLTSDRPKPARASTNFDEARERRHKPTFSVSAMPSVSDADEAQTLLDPPVDFLTPSRSRDASTPPLNVQITGSAQTNAAQPPPSPIAPAASSSGNASGLVYQPRHRRIERLHMRQLGEATPDVMHPFFTKKAGFSLEDALPQYVHEYATMPIGEMTRALLKLYSRQLSRSAPQ
ncbi:hypothetical protein EDB83DRAFT_2538792 [Lactarius deliciosus]|nr:hypothetical protein EDB83DRAFT_2538792 [Lactarius deliciosus]